MKATKASDGKQHAVLLVPVEFWVDNKNKIYDQSKEALGVSNWVTNTGLPTESNFTDTCDDPKNFRLSVTTIDPAQTSVDVKLEVKRNGLTVLTVLSTLNTKEGDKFRSRFLRLVTDDEDDAASQHGVNTDPNDQTIKVQLGDTLKLSYDLFQGCKIESSILVGRPVEENNNSSNFKKQDIREVKLNIIVFRIPGTDNSDPQNLPRPSASRQKVLQDVNSLYRSA